MNQGSEPQKRSEAERLYKNFMIDAEPAKLSRTISDIETQLYALDTRIQKIVHAFPINNTPFMEYLLNYAQNPDELKPFAEGLIRVAALVKKKRELESKRNTLGALRDHPSWFIGTLNDLDTEIDELLSTAFGGPEDQSCSNT